MKKGTFYVTVKVDVEYPGDRNYQDVVNEVSSEMDYEFSFDEQNTCIMDTIITDVITSG